MMLKSKNVFSFEAWFNVDDLRSDDVDEQIVAEEQKKNILSMLHQILTPFMLRRLKVGSYIVPNVNNNCIVHNALLYCIFAVSKVKSSWGTILFFGQADVELLVPPKREVLVYAPLSEKQEELYKMTVDKTILSWVVAKKVMMSWLLISEY